MFERFKRWLHARPQKIPSSLPSHLRVGIAGENAAATFYYKKGFDILLRNSHVGKSEIDLIAEDKECIVFCEVKARIADPDHPSPFGRPAAAVTPEKQRFLIRAAGSYVRRYRKREKKFRFDVIEVYLTPKLKVKHLHHIRNAFTR